MNLEDLKFVLEKVMELNFKEIEVIVNNEVLLMFENVIVEMECVGVEFGCVFMYYGIWSLNKFSFEFCEIQVEMLLKLLVFFI